MRYEYGSERAEKLTASWNHEQEQEAQQLLRSCDIRAVGRTVSIAAEVQDHIFPWYSLVKLGIARYHDRSWLWHAGGQNTLQTDRLTDVMLVA